MKILNQKRLVAHREANAKLSDPKAELKLFKAMSKLIGEQPDNSPLLFIGFGKKHVGILPNGKQALGVKADPDVGDEDGDVESVDISSFSRGWKFSRVNEADQSMLDDSVGSAATNKMVGDVRVAAGVCLIIGGASTAKTPFAHAIAGAGGRDYAVVRYGEPLAGYCLDPNEMALQLGEALITCSDIVLDSVKDILAFASGGAMASGISRGSFPILSDLSALAAQRGATIYIPFNPSNVDEKTVNALIEAARSNVTTTIVGNSTANPSVSEWTVFTRRGEGLLRDNATLRGSFKPNSLIMEIVGTASTQKSPTDIDVKSPAKSSLVDVELEAVIRRSVKGVN